MDFLRLVILLVLAWSLWLPGVALAEPAKGIFTAAQTPASLATADAPGKGRAVSPLRSRAVRVDVPALFPAAADNRKSATPAAPLTLNLFDDVTVTMTPRQSEAVGKAGTTVLVGDNDAATGGQTRFANVGGVLHGIVRTSGPLLYEITAVGNGDGNGVYVIREIDQRTYPDEHEVLPPDAGPAASDASQPASVVGDSGDTIDVMVLYTPSAKSAAGGQAAMDALIALAVSETNQGYANSGVAQRFRLVHAQETAYVETSFNTSLSDLRGTSDGQMDDIHALRNQYGADIVSLFINDGTSCGLGYLMTSTGWDFAANAFNVVDYTCATGYYSFAHECGHNQGAHHDRASASGSILYEYAYGYQQTSASPAFRTIMAYNCSPSCTRVNYWSNPEVNYNGYPTGVLYTAGTAADNRRTLNNTRAIAANWRQAIPSVGGIAAPSSLLLLGQ